MPVLYTQKAAPLDRKSARLNLGLVRKAGGVGFVLFLVFLALAGCGKRPGDVDPPPSMGHETASHEKGNGFPRTYPDIATDPTP